MYDFWFIRAFPFGNENGPLLKGPNIISAAFDDLLDGNGSRFKNELTGISRFVLAEDEIKNPDSKQKLNNLNFRSVITTVVFKEQT